MFGALGLGLPALGSGGGGGLPQIPLILGDIQYLNPLFTHTRPSAKWGFSGGNLAGFGNNVTPWVDGPGGGQGLLPEQSGINHTINARGEGAVVGVFGAGGSAPTGHAQFANSGLSVQVVSTAPVNDVPGTTYRLFGTSAGTFYVAVSRWFEGQIAASGGQRWCSSAYFQRLAGVWTGIRLSVGYRETGGANAAPETLFSPSGLLERRHFAGTMTTGVTAVVPSWGLDFPNATAIDITFFIGGFQMEQTPAPTSLMLPAPGTPAVTTRAGDDVSSLALASLIPDIANWAILTEFVVFGPTGNAYPSTFSISNAAQTARFTAAGQLNSRTRALYVVGGTGGASFGDYVDGVLRKEIVGVTGGTIRASTNGGAVASSAYTLNTSAIDRIFLGAITPSGGNALNGIIRRQILFPAWPGDAAARALSA